MAQRITANIVPTSGKILFSGGVTIRLDGGSEFKTFIAEADGTGTRRLSEARVVEKFAATAGSVLTPDARDRLVDLILHVEKFESLGALAAATTIPGIVR